MTTDHRYTVSSNRYYIRYPYLAISTALAAASSKPSNQSRQCTPWTRRGGLTKGENLEPTFPDHLLGLGFLGTLQTNDQGDRQLEFLGSLDDAFGDDLSSGSA